MHKQVIIFALLRKATPTRENVFIPIAAVGAMFSRSIKQHSETISALCSVYSIYAYILRSKNKNQIISRVYKLRLSCYLVFFLVIKKLPGRGSLDGATEQCQR